MYRVLLVAIPRRVSRWVVAAFTAALFVTEPLYPNGFSLAAAEMPTESPVSQAMHRGRAGIYYALSKRDRGLNYEHPLVDAVILGASWAELEPQQGRFQFDALLKAISLWGKAGKGVVVHTPLYGQAKDDSVTPGWVYEAGVRRISFLGGGVAKGARVSVPAVWEEEFVERYMRPLVSSLSDAISENPHVWYVMPAFGHIGNLNAQPSKDGGQAFKLAGWTPEKWAEYVSRVMKLYQDSFPTAPLLVKSAPRLLRDRREGHYALQADQLLAYAAGRGASVISFGLSPDPKDIQRVSARLQTLADPARTGRIRLGVGDDWPLWVPTQRRTQGPTMGRGEQFLLELKELLAGKVGGLPITMLYCLEPEISASNPKHSDHLPEVESKMRAIREQLLKNDFAITSGKNEARQVPKSN